MFYFYLFTVLLSSYYILANLLSYQRCWDTKINLLSALMYLIRLSLMKFRVCYNLISFLIYKIAIECPEEVFKKLWSITIYIIILENSFLKSQIFDKLVAVLLLYHFSVTKGLFKFLLMHASLSVQLKYMFP